ncbi:MAG TPA: NAD(P)-binding domain-containing protein [Pseudonocardia sp.]|jgi:cation diffusion facilitator CzcD-associated flavoprotein CzcO|uniref:flavin-containing monooxygenase n=1 Tax=Pseudonocardia sp. TaxID=60912 RepID=UPI002B4B09F6|nr:NAD(P)-binding domain-containing protein [Pseudonocardia sp.]HLU57207.1 NAD(P)-binding domain-containing protein [Pseudonocardia sp.]
MSVKACIIGAGASGVTVAKSLRQRGIAFDWFEKGSALGGLWRYDNDSGTSSAYRSLQIDTSSRSLAYPDFPVPREWPAYLRASQVLEYLERYAAEFGVADLVQTSTEVTAVERVGDRWAVTTDRHGTGTYDAVIVANGHLTVPRRPNFPGTFTGEELHSHDYRTPEPFSGRTVVVVGMGNSGCDIAVDLARVARQVHLSTRRSAWVLPKFLFGVPTDRWSAFFTRKLRLPTPVARNLVKVVARAAYGPQERYGVPRPRHPIHREHATIGQELLPYVAYDWIRIRPDVARLDGREVRFTDGTSTAADVIIYATGYEPSFPFLPEALVDAADRGARLYRRIVHPDAPGLFFAGLVQPVGPTIPLVEIQGRWIARVLTGEVELPDPQAMEREIAAHRRWVRASFVGSERYRLEVDFRTYAGQLTADMAA